MLDHAGIEASEAELRLLGRLDDKRVLELGCGAGATAVAMAKAGARVIGVDESADRIHEARRRSDDEETKIELHHSDLADLAFVRADTIDAAISVLALATVEDPGRVFRQVHRVLRPEAPLVLSLPHPASRLLGRGDDGQPAITGRYFGPLTISDVFTALTRANFRVDTILEPEPSPTAPLPVLLILRARKEGI